MESKRACAQVIFFKMSKNLPSPLYLSFLSIFYENTEMYLRMSLCTSRQNALHPLLEVSLWRQS